MIKNFVPRIYQEAILASCAMRNTLVVLPTGLGKTNIFLMIAAQRLMQYPDSKILLIGPTRPLISQYYDVFAKYFEIEKEKMAIFTGQVQPLRRQEMWKNSKIVFSTPQGLENDIISRKIILDEVSLLGIDEAHRAVGDYSYVWIAEEYANRSRYPRIVGLTASPGTNKEKVEEVCRNLHIEGIEVRSQEDPDVSPFVKEIELTNIKVELPKEFLEIKKYLEECYKSKLRELKSNGYLNSITYVNKKDLLTLQSQLIAKMSSGTRDFQLMRSVSLIAESMKVLHGLELLESQGISPLKSYMDKMFSQARIGKVKAVQNLVKDVNFKSASILIDNLYEKGTEHPKIAKLKEIVSKTITDDAKVIVFTQYRDTAVKIAEELSSMESVTPKIFVGQQKKGETGLSQKKQIEMLSEFRNGEFNTIIMTSVGEEGLDIPSVDLVIFYEPVPSAIRSIQRRGRTGRQDKGNVIVLIAKDTRDESYKWAAHHKEKRMYSILRDLRKNITLRSKEKAQPELSDFTTEEVMIFADYREKGSPVLKKLVEMKAKISLEKLDVADYQLSPRVAIEYKTDEDFVSSLIDGRLLSQAKELRANFLRPAIIVEGTNDIYSLRNVHPNAIRGLISTITIDFGIPIISTKNPIDTSAMIWLIAKREQQECGKSFSPHGNKKPGSQKEILEYIVSAFPGIGISNARELLKRFKNIKSIVNADKGELKSVPKIGDILAEKLLDSFNEEYK